MMGFRLSASNLTIFKSWQAQPAPEQIDMMMQHQHVDLCSAYTRYPSDGIMQWDYT